MEVTSLCLLIAGIGPLVGASPICRQTDAIEIQCFHFAAEDNFFDCHSNFIFSLPQKPGYIVLNDIEAFFSIQLPPKAPRPNPTRIPFVKTVRVFDDSKPDAKDYFVDVSAVSLHAGWTRRLRISAPRDSRFQMKSIEVDI